MRVILLTMLLALSFSAHAESEQKNEKMLWPRLTVWPTGVDLFINNPTADDYRCSGTIYMNHQSGRMTTEFYFNRVYSRMIEQRHIFNRFFNDRIINAYHNIFCNRL